MTTAIAEPDAHTPAWAVVVLGLLLLPLAALGFALSFQMMLPVMVIAGWSAGIAWGGPVLVDLAAASGALMQMVSRDRGIRWWGTGVLGFSTLLSIFMNLAGHSIERDGHALPPEYAGMRLGVGWQWVVILMSIATPLFIAVLVHAFGHVLMAYLATRSTTRSAPIAVPAAAPIDTRSDSIHVAADRVGAPIGPGPAASIGPADRPSTEAGPPIGSTPVRTARPAIGSTPDQSGEQQESTPIEQDRPTRSTPDPAPASPRSDQPDPIGSAPRSSRSDRPATRSIEDLLIEAHEVIDRGELDRQPSAESIRKTLSIAPARAREVRDRLRGERPLRVVGIDA